MTEAKPAKKAPAAKKPAPAKAGPAKGQLKIIQVGSPIGRQAAQRETLIGLGLNKIRRERTLEDSPAVRGMIARVKHLVRVEQA